MSDWTIKYRSATGPTVMVVRAETQEKAEAFFYDVMLDGDTFGSILTIAPVVDGSAAPQA